MPSFLRGLFESKAAPKNAVPRAVSNTRGYTGAVPGSQSWDIDQALIQGYERVIWIYRCVDAISSNSSSIPIIVREYDEDGKVVDDPDLLKLLNRRPNIYETAQQFRYRLASQLLLSRRGAFVEVVRNRAGRPIELHLLPPGATTPIPDPDKYVSGYQVQTVQQGIVELDADQVLWIRAKPHPTDVYAQMTPLVVAGLAADTDFLARLYNRNFLLNDGRPGMLVAVQGQLGIEDAEEIRRRFSGGAGAAGQTTVIEAEGIEVKDMTSSPRDVQWQDAVAGSKEDILLAFGVPESVIGNASGRCVDDQTEALTQRGWVNGHDLTTDDVILSADPADGQLKWGPVHEVYRNPHYSGDMYRLRHAHADFLVTPGHNWLTTDGELVKVEDLTSHSRLVLMGEAESSQDKVIYDDAFVELVGWTVTEGHYGGKQSPYIRIRQNDGANSIRIEDALQRYEADYSTYFDGKKWLFNVRGRVAAEIDQVAPDKIMDREFILALTADQRQLLMDTMIDGDGCRQDGTKSLTFAQKDERASEAFVFLATLCGYSTSMRERWYTYRHKGVERRQSDWIVIVRHRKVMTTQRDTISMEHYDGFVWCPRTDYGTFVARRNGRVFVTGNTFDNADAEFEIFWSVTMLPFLDAIGAGFDILTPGGNEDNLVVAHDYSTVDVLQRQKRARDERKMAEFKAGTLTIDEYLEAVGRAPLKVPGTEVLWLPQGMVPVGKNEEVTKAAAGLMPVGQPPDQGQQAAAQAGAEQGVQQGLAVAQRNFDNQNAARALRLAGKQGDPFDGEVETKVFSIEEELPPHPYEAERNAVEAEIGAHLSAWSRRQQRAIIERLGGTKARKHTRHWDGDPGTKALNAQYIVNPEQWADDLVEDMSDLFRELVEREAMKAARELNKAGVIQKINDDGGGNPRGRSPLDKILGGDRTQVMIEAVESVEEWVRESALRQSQRVADKIAEMDEQGASMAEIKREVEKMVDSRSSWRKGLSIAAATSAMEGARNEVYKRGGKYVQRRWRTMRDERVRPAHRRAHNQRRAANKPFKVGGFPMMYPGDPTAPIHLTANCFPADTEVVGRIDGAYRRLYSGTMIEVTTAEGENLTGTPNHPVLTDQGWVPLGLLVEGTQVIGYDGNVDPAVGVDVHHKPLAIGEVYDSLAVAGVRVASVGVDFHGEVAEGNVDVVGTDRLLRSDGKTAADEFVRQLLLPSSDPMSGPLLGGGSFGEFGDGALLASHSLVSSSTPSLPLIGSGVSHSGGQSGGAVTRLHSVLDQECADGTTPDTDFLSQGLLRLPGKVRLDVVTRVRRIEGWSGHVYNLSTETGAYASNGIVVHNCRCWVEPYVVGQTVESEPRQGVPKSRTVRRVKPKPKARTTTAAGTERRSA